MKEYTNKEESRINLEAESDYKKIYLDNEDEIEIIPAIAPPSCKVSFLYF